MPHHIHDCDTCRFLGNTIGGGKRFDLYVHEGKGYQPTTLIARYGRDGDYYSCPPILVRPSGHAELMVAALLYYQGGLPHELLVHIRGQQQERHDHSH